MVKIKRTLLYGLVAGVESHIYHRYAVKTVVQTEVSAGRKWDQTQNKYQKKWLRPRGEEVSWRVRQVNLDLNIEWDFTFQLEGTACTRPFWQEETKCIQKMERKPLGLPHKCGQGGGGEVTAGHHDPANQQLWFCTENYDLKTCLKTKMTRNAWHYWFSILRHLLFLGLVALLVKNLSANAGDISDTRLVPGLGRSPGVRHGNLFQYSCLKKPMDNGAWQATLHSVAKSQTWLKFTFMNYREKWLRQKVRMNVGNLLEGSCHGWEMVMG